MADKFESVEICFTDQSGNETPGLVVAPEDYAALKAENAMLWEFVRAFDAWYQSEYACKGELYEALKPARLALGPIPPTAPPHTPRT